MSEEPIYIGSEQASLTIRPPDIVDLEINHIRLPIELRAENLIAGGAIELEGRGGWPAAFLDFLDDLAADWRGWEGTKDWTDDSDAVSVRAKHNHMSQLLVTVSLRPFCGNRDRGTWELEVDVPQEAGRMSDVARAARFMFASAGVPSTALHRDPTK